MMNDLGLSFRHIPLQRVFNRLETFAYYSKRKSSGISKGSVTSKTIPPQIVLAMKNKKKKKLKMQNDERSKKNKPLNVESETDWLNSLSYDKLKLFRRTSIGSFRKINNEKLLERLKFLLDENSRKIEEVNKKGGKEKVTITVEFPYKEEKKENVEKEKKLSRPSNRLLRLPDLVIRNMTNFPMIKSHDETISKEELNARINSHAFPSVTKILGETKSEESKLALEKWKQKLIAEMGEEAFLQYQLDLFSRGSRLHKCLKQYLETGDETSVQIAPDIEPSWKSLEKILPEISDVRILEEAVTHPILLYKGVVDCVASYRDVPCVIEWKKSDRKKLQLSSTYDAPLQVCAYLGALSWCKPQKDSIKNGLVVVAYSDGSPADVFQMNYESCSSHWIHWSRRLQQYWLLNSYNVSSDQEKR